MVREGDSSNRCQSGGKQDMQGVMCHNKHLCEGSGMLGLKFQWDHSDLLRTKAETNSSVRRLPPRSQRETRFEWSSKGRGRGRILNIF